MCFSEDLLKKAGHVARDELLAFGTCFGKFTKTSKFRLHITALDFLAPYAKVISIIMALQACCALVCGLSCMLDH